MVMVLASATVDVKVNVAIPLSPVVAVAGLKLFPLPDELGDTEASRIEAPLTSLTCTVIVLLPKPAMNDTGAADAVEFDALGAPAVPVTVNLAVAPDTTFSVFVPGAAPSVQLALAWPFPSLVLAGGLTLPPPSPTSHVTGAPGIGLLLASRTSTTTATTEPAGAEPTSPEIFTTLLTLPALAV
jgi:hypothetical protein